jgi:[ribosomal protein S5]-alanine N-acetyltransferase
MTLDGQAGFTVELATRRFLLRDFRDADAPAFEAYHNDPRSQEFYGAEQAEPGHARHLIALFSTWAAAQPRLNYQLAIVQRNSPHALIGCCGIRCAGSEPGTAELGIELAPEYWGRYAYAVEVLRALVEFGFGPLRLRAIYGATVSANSRIARLVSAFGATAVTRPTPAWMSGRGWTQVEWRITMPQWQRGRLTKRSKPDALKRAAERQR